MLRMNRGTRQRNWSGAEGAESLPSRWMAIILAGLLLAVALAIGGVHAPSSAAMEMCLWVVAALWFAANGRGRLPGSLVASAGALYIYLFLQQVPLPPLLVETLSPGTAEVARHTLGAVGAGSGSYSPIESVSEAEDAKVSVSMRTRIRALAEPHPSVLPEGWRSLAINRSAAREDLLRYLAYGVGLWLAATTPAPFLLLRLAVYVGFSIATLGLVEFLTWNGHVLWFFDPYDGPLGEDLGRMIGPFVNADHFAAFLIMLVGPGVALISAEARRMRRGREDRSRALIRLTALALGLAILVAGVVGSASRGGIVGALLGALFFWAGTRGEAEPRRDSRGAWGPRNRAERLEHALWRAAPYALGTLTVAVGLFFAASAPRTLLDVRLGQTILAPDLEFRATMVTRTLPMIRDFMVFGVGAGSWSELFLRYARYPFVGFAPNHAHDDYIEWAAEVGVAGLILTLLVVWRLARSIRANAAIPLPIYIGILGGVSAIAWLEIFDFALRVPANALLLALLVGLLCNPDWREPPRRTAGRLALGSRLVAIVAVVLLCWASTRQVLESWQWRRVADGSADLEFSPQTADTWVALASLLYQSGFRYRPPTEECLYKAIRLRPTSRGAFWLLSFVVRSDAAKLASLEAALYLDPRSSAARLQYVTLLDTMGRSQEAITQFEEACYRDSSIAKQLSVDPKNERSPEPAVAAAERGFQRALSEHPDAPSILDDVASFYSRFGRFDQAANLWLRASAASDRPNVYVRRAAAAYVHAGNYLRAGELLRREIDLDPSQAENYRLLAESVYCPQQKFEEAEQALTSGLPRVAAPWALYQALYELRHQRGDEKAAISALEKLAELRVRDAGAQFQLGMAYLRAEDYHRAKIAFDHAIAADPKQAGLYFHKGLAAERLYDLAGALENYRKAVALEPGNPAYSQSLEQVSKTLNEAPRN